MLRAQTLVLTMIAMIAFAANSLLCRYALSHSDTDPASFTSIRILSGAVILWLITRLRTPQHGMQGNWRSAFALFGYAAAFSFAYVSLPAATGALLLFGSVQATMIGYGLMHGERLRGVRLIGFLAALAGLVALLLPGVSAPPLPGSVLMVGSGIAWAVYSLRGKGATDPTAVTAGNFCRAACFAVGLSIIMLPWSSIDLAGLAYAVLSGAFASGIGYVIWYMALSGLNSVEAATVQLSVPVIAGAGGVLILAEPLSLRLVLCAATVLSGVALVIIRK
ncbi:DMT family transporter [Noviherbaspirillum saxi]|uniref:DMT family transporter n=1 Tax=Noviherbaspirillum saxi TaxID=2320863 RepID=A0A3A3FFT0_9BURK|nr:DMT family transporter [Noviherbaspirillum saxi]RJF92201.1 DMT family transporter [Noviherbaspirillum saxi]